MRPSNLPFPRRFGYAGEAAKITVREDAPKDLRFAFLEITRALLKDYRGDHKETEIRDVVAAALKKWLDPSVRHYDDVWQQVKNAVYSCEWFRVYQLIEAVSSYFDKTAPAATEEFTIQLNECFVEQGIGWQLVDGEVRTRGDETFERTLKTAVDVLARESKPTAAKHLRSALRALSARPEPDTSGAVAHATNAVECVLGEITGQETTLGAYLDKHPRLFHRALKKGLDGVYGYASDAGARHGKEGTEPAREEAEFAVAVCAAICTLLTRKHPK
jgi:hypothetical protein